MSRLDYLLGKDMRSWIDEINAEEIRIKRSGYAVLGSKDNTVITSCYYSSEEFDEIILRACNYSYYSHEETIKKGYINATEGIRIGVCGRAVIDGDTVKTITDIDYIVIRIPHYISGISTPVVNTIIYPEVKSILIYSPPGIGKTTLIRDISVALADVPYNKKVVLIDSRQEIYLDNMKQYPLLAVYSGYPKDWSIEAAVRTLSPDFLITDEIGSMEEAEQLGRYQNSGVSIVATAHACDLRGLLNRPGIKPLHIGKCFDLYCGIKRKNNELSFKFNAWEEAEKCLKL